VNHFLEEDFFFFSLSFLSLLFFAAGLSSRAAASCSASAS